MNPALLSALIALVVCIIGIGAHAVATAWWASKITTTLDVFGKTLEGVVEKYEDEVKERYTKTEAKEDHAKRDELIATMWKKFDVLRDDFAVLKNDVNNLKNGNGGGK